jgi:hypothetical protein
MTRSDKANLLCISVRVRNLQPARNRRSIAASRHHSLTQHVTALTLLVRRAQFIPVFLLTVFF